mgnify:CR=1 FL=1
MGEFSETLTIIGIILGAICFFVLGYLDLTYTEDHSIYQKCGDDECKKEYEKYNTTLHQHSSKIFWLPYIGAIFIYVNIIIYYIKKERKVMEIE